MSEPISKRLQFDEQTIFTNPPLIFKELSFTFVLLIDWWYHWIIRRKWTNDYFDFCLLHDELCDASINKPVDQAGRVRPVGGWNDDLRDQSRKKHDPADG